MTDAEKYLYRKRFENMKIDLDKITTAALLMLLLHVNMGTIPVRHWGFTKTDLNKLEALRN